MKYHRLGHIKPEKSLKIGAIVRSGDVVGNNSTGNGKWAAHVHFDILAYEPKKWTEYVIGQSKDWVIMHYHDPRGLEKAVLPTFDHLGYGWLSPAVYSGKNAIHPGLDLNGKGSGNDDIDDPVHSPCTGVVRYVYHGEGSNEGWGGLLVIEEKIIEQPMKKEFIEALEETLGYKKGSLGENLNEKEQEDVTDRLKKVREEIEESASNLTALSESIRVAEDRLERITILEEEKRELSAKLSQCQTTETPDIPTDPIDSYSLTELAGAFFRKLISIKK